MGARSGGGDWLKTSRCLGVGKSVNALAVKDLVNFDETRKFVIDEGFREFEVDTDSLFK